MNDRSRRRKKTTQSSESLTTRAVPADPKPVDNNLSLLSQGSKTRRYIKRGLLLLLAALVISAGLFVWEVYSAAANLTGIHSPVNLIDTLLPQKLAETNGRVNILLAGYSAGIPSHPGPLLTDSIMIISLNPKNKLASLISVPRDLWVKIPATGYSKINAAYEDGLRENFHQKGYFPGGMGLLQKVVSQVFAIKFNYYALINYAALKDAVNAVGGITVDIQSPDPRGIYDAYTNLKLPNGLDALNGQQALDLARARGDTVAGDVSYGLPDSDFTRTQHQQQMLVALKDKAAKLTSLINPITVLKLVKAVGGNVKTNFNIGQMETLYQDAKVINNKNINQVTLNDYNGKNLIANYYTDNQATIIPAAGPFDYSQLQQAVKALLNQ